MRGDVLKQETLTRKMTFISCNFFKIWNDLLDSAQKVKLIGVCSILINIIGKPYYIDLLENRK